MSSMSATYFVLPPAGTSWKMELNSFEKALRERWPDAIVERPAQSTRNKWSGGVEWTLRLAPDAKTRSVAGRWLDACLSRDGQAARGRILGLAEALATGRALGRIVGRRRNALGTDRHNHARRG
jgi:hypothetical protein